MSENGKKFEPNVGALWVKKSKSTGVNYMSGHLEIGETRFPIVLFKNKKYVEGGKFPFFHIYLSKTQDNGSNEPVQESTHEEEIPF